MHWCASPYYSRLQGQAFDCGTCQSCRRKRVSDWSLRLKHEFRSRKNTGVFLTLTYDDLHLVDLSKHVFQNFIKRVRIDLDRFADKLKVKYFGCGEYGPKTHRPHYHIAILGITLKQYRTLFLTPRWTRNRTNTDRLWTDSNWDNGHITATPLTDERCYYVAGYIQKKLGNAAVREFQLQSRGIGLDYCLAHAESIIANLHIKDGKYKKGVPRYYRKKLGITEEHYKDVIYNAYYKSLMDYIRETGLSPFLEHTNPYRVKLLRKYMDMDRNPGCDGYLIHPKIPFINDNYLDWRRRQAKQHNANLEAKYRDSRSKV